MRAGRAPGASGLDLCAYGGSCWSLRGEKSRGGPASKARDKEESWGQGLGDKARVATPSGGQEKGRKASMPIEHLLYTR